MRVTHTRPASHCILYVLACPPLLITQVVGPTSTLFVANAGSGTGNHSPGLPQDIDPKDAVKTDRLDDPEELMKRRRAKDPEAFDKVHGKDASFAEETGGKGAGLCTCLLVAFQLPSAAFDLPSDCLSAVFPLPSTRLLNVFQLPPTCLLIVFQLPSTCLCCL